MGLQSNFLQLINAYGPEADSRQTRTAQEVHQWEEIFLPVSLSGSSCGVVE